MNGLRSGPVGDKALRLYNSGCVVLQDDSRARVLGDSGVWHEVVASEEYIRCSCRAWSTKFLCSHSAAASIAWAVRLEQAS